MKSTVEYIEKAIAEGNYKTGSAFCKAIRWSNGALSLYRSRDRIMNRRACLQLAAFMKLDLKGTVKLVVLAEIEENGQLPLDTKHFFQKVAVSIGFTVLTGLIAITPSIADAASRPCGITMHESSTKSSRLTVYKLCTIWSQLKRALRRIWRKNPIAQAKMICPLFDTESLILCN